MGKPDKILQQVLLGNADNNVEFIDLRSMLLWLGFEERIRGSHHIYVKTGVVPQINIQRRGHLVPDYQVRKIRKIIWEYKLHV